jgi:hypothetical protein
MADPPRFGSLSDLIPDCCHHRRLSARFCRGWPQVIAEGDAESYGQGTRMLTLAELCQWLNITERPARKLVQRGDPLPEGRPSAPLP